MPKRHHEPYAAGRRDGLGIGSNSLTPPGQSDLLKHLGHHLQHSYQKVLKESAPDRIQQLLEKLERTRFPDEDDHH